jgi:hypothetical protein
VSSYDLSPFSSKAGSPPSEGAGAAPGGLSSASRGELRLGIDQLDEVGPESTSAVPTQDPRGGVWYLILTWTPEDQEGWAKVVCVLAKGLQ